MPKANISDHEDLTQSCTDLTPSTAIKESIFIWTPWTLCKSFQTFTSILSVHVTFTCSWVKPSFNETQIHCDWLVTGLRLCKDAPSDRRATGPRGNVHWASVSWAVWLWFYNSKSTWHPAEKVHNLMLFLAWCFLSLPSLMISEVTVFALQSRNPTMTPQRLAKYYVTIAFGSL